MIRQPDKTIKVLPKKFQSHSQPSGQSLEQFRLVAKKHQKEIEKAYNSITGMSDLLNGEEDVWPDQCDHIVRSLRSMRKPVQNFYELLDTDSPLPRAIDPLRYRLLVKLRHIERLLYEDVTPRVQTFRANCCTSSLQTMMQRQDVESRLETFLQDSKEALVKIEILIDQVRFVEGS